MARYVPLGLRPKSSGSETAKPKKKGHGFFNFGLSQLFKEIGQAPLGLAQLPLSLLPGGKPAGEVWSQAGKGLAGSALGTLATPFAPLGKYNPLEMAGDKLLGEEHTKDFFEKWGERGFLPALVEDLGNVSLMGAGYSAALRTGSVAGRAGAAGLAAERALAKGFTPGQIARAGEVGQTALGHGRKGKIFKEAGIENPLLRKAGIRDAQAIAKGAIEVGDNPLVRTAVPGTEAMLKKLRVAHATAHPYQAMFKSARSLTKAAEVARITAEAAPGMAAASDASDVGIVQAASKDAAGRTYRAAAGSYAAPVHPDLAPALAAVDQARLAARDAVGTPGDRAAQRLLQEAENAYYAKADELGIDVNTTTNRPDVGFDERQAASTDPRAFLHEDARIYAEANGLPEPRPVDIDLQVDPTKGRRIADAYARMTSDPNDPAVQAAYGALAADTIKQYEYLKQKGVLVEFVDRTPEGGAYPGIDELFADITQNNRIRVDRTGADEAHTMPIMNQVVEVGADGKPVTLNDAFRAVHDWFGHSRAKNGFSRDGEEVAYQLHRQMFSREAQQALATETRGQNSVLNYSPQNQTRKAAGLPGEFPAQKAGLLPEELQGDIADPTGTPPPIGPKEMQYRAEALANTPSPLATSIAGKLPDAVVKKLSDAEGWFKAREVKRVSRELERMVEASRIQTLKSGSVTLAQDAARLLHGQKLPDGTTITPDIAADLVDQALIADLTQTSFLAQAVKDAGGPNIAPDLAQLIDEVTGTTTVLPKELRELLVDADGNDLIALAREQWSAQAQIRKDNLIGSRLGDLGLENIDSLTPQLTVKQQKTWAKLQKERARLNNDLKFVEREADAKRAETLRTTDTMTRLDAEAARLKEQAGEQRDKVRDLARPHHMQDANRPAALAALAATVDRLGEAVWNPHTGALATRETGGGYAVAVTVERIPLDEWQLDPAGTLERFTADHEMALQHGDGRVQVRVGDDGLVHLSTSQETLNSVPLTRSQSRVLAMARGHLRVTDMGGADVPVLGDVTSRLVAAQHVADLSRPNSQFNRFLRRTEATRRRLGETGYTVAADFDDFNELLMRQAAGTVGTGKFKSLDEYWGTIDVEGRKGIGEHPADSLFSIYLAKDFNPARDLTPELWAKAVEYLGPDAAKAQEWYRKGHETVVSRWGGQPTELWDQRLNDGKGGVKTVDTADLMFTLMALTSRIASPVGNMHNALSGLSALFDFQKNPGWIAKFEKGWAQYQRQLAKDLAGKGRLTAKSGINNNALFKALAAHVPHLTDVRADVMEVLNGRMLDEWDNDFLREHFNRDAVSREAIAKKFKRNAAELTEQELMEYAGSNGYAKMRSFYDNLRDPEGSQGVTLDRVMADLLGLEGGNWNKNGVMKAGADAFRHLADQVSAAMGKPLQPHQLQSLLWVYTKRLTNSQDRGRLHAAALDAIEGLDPALPEVWATGQDPISRYIQSDIDFGEANKGIQPRDVPVAEVSDITTPEGRALAKRGTETQYHHIRAGEVSSRKRTLGQKPAKAMTEEEALAATLEPVSGKWNLARVKVAEKLAAGDVPGAQDVILGWVSAEGKRFASEAEYFEDYFEPGTHKPTSKATALLAKAAKQGLVREQPLYQTGPAFATRTLEDVNAEIEALNQKNRLDFDPHAAYSAGREDQLAALFAERDALAAGNRANRDVTGHHGTNAEFDKFNPPTGGVSSTDNYLNTSMGAFFSDNPRVAEGYGGNIKRAKLTGEFKHFDSEHHLDEALIENAIDEGYITKEGFLAERLAEVERLEAGGDPEELALAKTRLERMSQGDDWKFHAKAELNEQGGARKTVGMESADQWAASYRDKLQGEGYAGVSYTARGSGDINKAGTNFSVFDPAPLELFQKFADDVVKGAVYTNTKTGRLTMRFFETADPTTLVHESAHLLRLMLPEADIQTLLERYQGRKVTPPGQMRRRAEGLVGRIGKVAFEERFADDMLRHMNTNRAPAGLEQVFSRVRHTLRMWWGGVDGSLMDGIDPAVAEILDRYLNPQGLPDVALPTMKLDLSGKTASQIAAQLPRQPGETAAQALRRGYLAGRATEKAEAFDAQAAEKLARQQRLSRSRDKMFDQLVAVPGRHLPDSADPLPKAAAHYRASQRLDAKEAKWVGRQDNPTVAQVPGKWAPLWQSILDLHKVAETNPAMAAAMEQLPKSWSEFMAYAEKSGLDPIHVASLSDAEVRQLAFQPIRLGKDWRGMGTEVSSGTRKVRSQGFARTQSLAALSAAMVDVVHEGATNQLVGYIEDVVRRPIPEGGLIPDGFTAWDPVRTNLMKGKQVEGGSQLPDKGPFRPQYMIPNAVKKSIDEYSKDYSTGLLGTISKISKPWRMMVLTLTPRWYVNNMLGGMILASKEGIKLEDWIGAYKSWRDNYRPTAMATGESMNTNVLNEPTLVAQPKGGTGVYRTAREAGKGRLRSGAKQALAGVDRIGKMNEAADNFYRSAVYLSKKRKGYNDIHAMNMAKDAMVDYGNLSNLERQVIRQIIPFYAWQKGMFQIVARFPADHPQASALVMQLGLLNEQLSEGMPDAYRGVLKIPGLGNLQTKALNPFMDAGSLATPQGIAASANPFIDIAMRNAYGASKSGYPEQYRINEFGQSVPDTSPGAGLLDVIQGVPQARLGAQLGAPGLGAYEGQPSGMRGLAKFAGFNSYTDAETEAFKARLIKSRLTTAKRNAPKAEENAGTGTTKAATGRYVPLGQRKKAS